MSPISQGGEIMLDLNLIEKIEEKTDNLIEKAKKLVDKEFEIEKNKKKERTTTTIYRELDVSQIRNILNMAIETDSIKALILFIEYQIGRKKIPQKWGDILIEEIKNIENLVNEISTENKEVYLKLIRLFLGYLNRYFIFKKKQEEDKKEKTNE